MPYRIKYALAGGFGGVKNQEWEPSSAKNRDEAMAEARGLAIQEYESMEGMHGLRSVSDIVEEDGVSEAEAIQTREEEIESWLDYDAQLFADDGEEEEEDDDV